VTKPRSYAPGYSTRWARNRTPRTRATVGQLLDRWLQVLDVDPSTRRGYEGYIRMDIRPALGSRPLTRLDVETLDSFYAELRRCREHYDGRPHLQHRTSQPHMCCALADSTVRQIHWIISGALETFLVATRSQMDLLDWPDESALSHHRHQRPTADR
jgi:integrase